MNAHSLAKALGGVVTRDQILAPGPGHSPRDRSLAVFLDPSAPDGFTVFSHAGDDWRVCREHVLSKLQLSQNVKRRGGFRPSYQSFERLPFRNSPENAAKRISRVLALWDEAHDLIGTPGASYLARRGIDLDRLPTKLDQVLRWHPSCPWEAERHGCMLALMTEAVTGEPRAVHRTAVTAAGEKVGKKMLGPAAGCVVRLWPDEDVTSGLVLGEGVETTLAVATRIEHRSTNLYPAWAAGSASGLAKFPVLAGIEALTLLVDNDVSGEGQRAALECSDRWTAAGRQVIRLVPNLPGTDFNDLIRRGAA